MRPWLRWSLLLATCVVLSLLFWAWWRQDRLEHSQDNVIRMAAARYQVDPALVKAIIWRESKFNPRAQGRAQEIGLMQLREEAAREWADAEKLESFNHTDCFDANTNVMAGTYYLKKLMKRYRVTDDPVPFALADYNAGRANVLRWNKGVAATNSAAFIEQIGFPGTQEYVRSVMGRRGRYAGM